MRYATIGVLAFLIGWIARWNMSLSSQESAEDKRSSFVWLEEEQQAIEEDILEQQQEQEATIQEWKDKEQVFLRDGLTTDTSKTAIALEDILDWGPGKDGIPPIDAPAFLIQEQVGEQMSYLSNEALGIVIVWVSEQRFYPYAIMNWHEIVNDELDGTPLAVTFCPLCGSAIVFDRRVDDEVLRMGVSGKLFESNLLMYDDMTESLWSQARGKGVVGDFVDIKLSTYKKWCHDLWAIPAELSYMSSPEWCYRLW